MLINKEYADREYMRFIKNAETTEYLFFKRQSNLRMFGRVLIREMSKPKRLILIWVICLIIGVIVNIQEVM